MLRPGDTDDDGRVKEVRVLGTGRDGRTERLRRTAKG